MADYSVDVHVPNPVNSRVDVANASGSPFEVASSLDVGNRGDKAFLSETTLNLPDPIRTESLVELKPIKTDSTFHIPEPIRTESTAEIDLKPVALDQCVRIRLDPVPTTCIHQPYQQHIGFSFFGVEVFGIDVRGEARTTIEGKDVRPHVVPAGPRPTPATSHEGMRIRLDR